MHRFSKQKQVKNEKRQYMDPLETLIIREQQVFHFAVN